MRPLRWLMLIAMMMALAACGGRGESARGESGLRSPSMIDRIESKSLPVERSNYIWADP